MSQYEIVHYDEIEQLVAAEVVWDDLWRRSDVVAPTAQARQMAYWLKQFAPRCPFRAIVVRRGGRDLAALPLVALRRAGPLRVASLPGGEWSPGGELLCDQNADRDAVMDALVAALPSLQWPLLWLEGVDVEAPAYRDFVRAAQRAGLGIDWREHYRVGRVDTRGDWDAYRKSWSRNHRRNMNRVEHGLEEDGCVTLWRPSPTCPDEIQGCLRVGFEVEDRSWKGAAGTSVLRTPGMLEFYCRQAVELAERGQLSLALLNLDDRPIAFAYGWMCKGVYSPLKIGYDEAHAARSPGQILLMKQLEHCHEDPSCQWLDLLGPLSRAGGSWKPETYGQGRLVIAPRRLLGTALLRAYQFGRPLVGRIRATAGRNSTGATAQTQSLRP